MQFSLHLPINRVSFGQVSINILQEFFKKNLSPCVFPIGDVDVNAHSLSEEFKRWLEECINKSQFTHQRKNPTFKLWHIQGSLESLSEKQVLFTFHETDSATESELNIVKNNNKVLFSSSYSKNIFENLGCQNVDFLPLGFDSGSFKILNKPKTSDRISFGLGGKLERRKQHHKVLNLWAKRYGNNPDYALNCALFNPHLPPEVQESFIRQSLEGKSYWNINFLPYMENNEVYNDFLNENDIFIDMSSAEGWSLPSFQSACLGKWVVVLNATGMKEWANSENSILVQPSRKIPLYDGVFFREGAQFAQGSGFDWDENAFYEALEGAVNRFKSNPVNEAGFKLKEIFTWEKSAERILEELNKLN